MLIFRDFAFGNIVAYNLQGEPILGDIELLWASQFPLTRDDLLGMIEFRGHHAEDETTVECVVNIRFVVEDKREIITRKTVSIDSSTTWHNEQLEIKNLLVPMGIIVFDLPGSYIVEAVINGEIVAELPIEVEQRPAPSK